LVLPDWKTVTIPEAEDELVKLKIRIQANAVRRMMSKQEKAREALKFKELLEERVGHELSIAEVARELGIPRQTLSDWIGNLGAESSTEIHIGSILQGLSPSSVEWCDYEVNIYRGCYHNYSYGASLN